MNKSIRTFKFSIAIAVLVAICMLASGVLAEKTTTNP